EGCFERIKRRLRHLGALTCVKRVLNDYTLASNLDRQFGDVPVGLRKILLSMIHGCTHPPAVSFTLTTCRFIKTRTLTLLGGAVRCSAIGQDQGSFFRCQTAPWKYSYMLGGKVSLCSLAMCLRTISEYRKQSPQMRQCHWSRAKMYGRHSELFGLSLGSGIFNDSRRRALRRNHNPKSTISVPRSAASSGSRL